MASVKWGYSLNGFSVGRMNNRERTLKAMSVCGFRGIELRSATGPSAVFGRPESIELNFGSIPNLLAFLDSCGIDRIVSYFYDPGIAFLEEASFGRSASKLEDHDGIVESIRPFVRFLHNVGGSCLVVRPMGSYASEAPVTEGKIKTVGECWNKVGKMTKEQGVQTAMHVDSLCAIRNLQDIEMLLASTSPDLVGLALDTAELIVSGVDAVSLYEKHYARVKHFHFRDTTPSQPRSAGGQGGVERRFWEIGVPGGLVNFPALMASIKRHDYDGWIMMENEQSPNPVETCMLNSWYVHKVLS